MATFRSNTVDLNDAGPRWRASHDLSRKQLKARYDERARVSLAFGGYAGFNDA